MDDMDSDWRIPPHLFTICGHWQIGLCSGLSSQRINILSLVSVSVAWITDVKV